MTKDPASEARLSFANRLLVLVLLSGLPGVVATCLLIASGDLSLKAEITVLLLVGIAWLLLALAARSQGIRPFQNFTGILTAYRDGDFSVRARPGRADDDLGVALAELNALGDSLREQRLGAMEAWALLRRVLGEIDVAVLAFDENGYVRLANLAAERLLDKPAAKLVGQKADDLGVTELLSGEAPRTLAAPSFVRGAAGAWELRRGSFRLTGLPHTLVVLADLSHALREQEREAWRRLIRVMGHEINNSLAPIRSISESLERLLAQPQRPDDWEEDVARGLSVVARRADALGRFMAAYSRLARLPPPRLAPVSVSAWVERARELETRARVVVLGGPEAEVLGDADQLDQLLINLVKNAAEATLENGGEVRLRWSLDERRLRLSIEDDGPGVSETGNLFVPFFTTKPEGSGIGLALARQIAEAHGGEVDLKTRASGSGAEATVLLPLKV